MQNFMTSGGNFTDNDFDVFYYTTNRTTSMRAMHERPVISEHLSAERHMRDQSTVTSVMYDTHT